MRNLNQLCSTKPQKLLSEITFNSKLVERQTRRIHALDLMVGDRDSDMGAGWAVGARLFQVDENLGIQQVIERIKNNEKGDYFTPV